MLISLAQHFMIHPFFSLSFSENMVDNKKNARLIIFIKHFQESKYSSGSNQKVNENLEDLAHVCIMETEQQAAAGVRVNHSSHLFL